LVRIAEDFVRVLNSEFGSFPEVSTNNQQSQLGFANVTPFLMVSTESLEEVGKNIPSPIPNFTIRRFRPNIVISGCKPFEEDLIQKFQIGNIIFESLAPCARCPITTIDPATGIFDRKVEPLNTIVRIHSGEITGPYLKKSADTKKVSKPFFGMKVVHRNTGIIAVGQPLIILTK